MGGLSFYSERFRAVEVNNTFYRLPHRETLVRWRDETPPDFVFAVEASRYITHMKKLKDAGRSVEQFMDHGACLQPKLGPVLFQLPPNWKIAPARLEDFLAVLPQNRRVAFEFRDTTWWADEIYAALRMSNAAFCIVDLAGRTSPREATFDFVYLRLHDPGNAYQGQYGSEGLQPWAHLLSGWRERGREVFCFFDNDQDGYAPADAHELQAMVGVDRR